MALAGLGAIGDVLSDAALGAMRGFMGPSWDEEKAERERKARAAEAKITLDEAHAAYYGQERSRAAARRRQLIQDKGGNWWDVPEEGGLPTKILEGPPVEPKEVDPQKAFGVTVLGAIERKLGKPQSEWSSDDLARPDVRPLIDLLQRRSDIIVAPGWGPLLAPDIRKQLQPREQPVPAPAPLTDAPAPSPRTAPAPDARQPAVPPATTRGQESRDMLPMVERAVQTYSGWSESALQTELEQVSSAEADSPSIVNKAKLTAIGRVLAGRRRAPQTRPAPAVPAR